MLNEKFSSKIFENWERISKILIWRIITLDLWKQLLMKFSSICYYSLFNFMIYHYENNHESNSRNERFSKSIDRKKISSIYEAYFLHDDKISHPKGWNSILVSHFSEFFICFEKFNFHLPRSGDVVLYASQGSTIKLKHQNDENQFKFDVYACECGRSEE